MKRLLLSIVSITQLCGQTITTVAGDGTQGFSGDGGIATAAWLAVPLGVAVDVAGNVYIAEAGSNNRIRKVNTSGIITTIAGNGTAGYSGDGGPAISAAINAPFGVTVDASGNLYIPDFSNNRIRKVNTSGVITTIVGTGTGSFGGDGGPATAAQIWGPTGVAFDASGNMYVSEYNNNRIRKINTSGIITTVVGTGTAGFSGDGGQATLAKIKHPSALAFDASGNLYFSDCNNNRIRKVDASGVITTVVGNGTAGFSGDGGQAILAEINDPDGIAFDASGNLFIADDVNNRIRKINTAGIISTVAGTGVSAYCCDGMSSLVAGIGNPNGICLDAAGYLYITDTGNNRIRKITNEVSGIGELAIKNELITIYPNPANENFIIETNATDSKILTLHDVNGKLVFSQIVNNKSNIDLTTLNAGVYTLTVKTVDCFINKKLVIIK